MNNSEENVTLVAAFVTDILTLFKEKESLEDYNHLKEMTKGLSLEPTSMVPISVYNKMCGWIENHIGEANTRKLGRKIGNTAFNAMVSYKLISEKPTPEQAMKGLALVAQQAIRDPLKRGWDILEVDKKHIVMRRTQTFNSVLQLGLLDEIIRKTGVLSPKVEYKTRVSNGDEFDEYKISWL